jgi:hypothetical protein
MEEPQNFEVAKPSSWIVIDFALGHFVTRVYRLSSEAICACVAGFCPLF